ncbi:MAG: STAS domain-containing protein [Planctomycetaceae bacterium]
MSVGPQPDIQRIDDVTVVSFDPTVQSINESYLSHSSEALLSVVNAQPPRVVLDMAGVKFFNSSFIEILFRIWNRVQSTNGRFAICNLDPYCLEVLQVTNLTTLWTIVDSRDAALAAVRSAA